MNKTIAFLAFAAAVTSTTLPASASTFTVTGSGSSFTISRSGDTSAAEVTVVFEDAKPCTVYALSSDGSRRGEVPVIQKGGKVSFVANTARDSAEATCYYEIIRIWYN